MRSSSDDLKRFSAAADRNREAIVQQLSILLPDPVTVLELGSGTGQHACHFAPQLPHVCWQPTDLSSVQVALSARLQDEGAENIKHPLVLDVLDPEWPVAQADVIFTANTFHIVSARGVECIFTGAARTLTPAGRLIVYGPFSQGGQHNSDGNAAFDAQLRADNPVQGIRDLSWLNQLAIDHGFTDAVLTPMPANNFIAVWHRAD